MEKKRKAVKSPPKKYTKTVNSSEDKLTFTGKVKKSLRSAKIEKLCCKTAYAAGLAFPKKTENAEIGQKLFRCSACAPHFLRGVFLASGSVNAPGKGHHLEMKVDGRDKAQALARVLGESGFEAKISARCTADIVYFKDGDVIFGFLNAIGAQKCAFDFLDVLIEKQVRNDCNRKTNFDAANMAKTAAAGKRQTDAIRLLCEIGEMEKLSEVLQTTAALKLENPSLNLSELAALHEPPITKSCVNHRLNKIIEVYEKLSGVTPRKRL